MQKSQMSSPIQLPMFPSNTAKPPLPASVTPRVLALLAKLLRGASQQAEDKNILRGDHE